ncbi:dienelactone hydrolase family protein [Kitasatospora kazusensis]|uniref:Dienelactone hydrolase family protein n=1 Tax=Kitasatospora kazusensis TaxID=407974 RepID=A0ABN2ZP21_9ACTN
MPEITGSWEPLGTADAPGPEAYVIRPTGAVLGSVVVCSELYGVNEYVREVCDRLAATGYAAVAPDYYWRQARRPDFPYTAEGREDGLALMRRLDRDELLADAALALAAARALAPDRGTAFLGLSMGGHIALRAATALRFELAAVFYPGWALNSGFPLVGPVPPVEQSGDIAANGVFVLGFVGDRDHIVPQEEWQAVERRLTAARVPHELVTYPGAGHGFACEDRPADYEPAAGDDAWRRVFEAFGQYL